MNTLNSKKSTELVLINTLTLRTCSDPESHLIVLDVDEFVDRHGDYFHRLLHHLLGHIRALESRSFVGGIPESIIFSEICSF